MTTPQERMRALRGGSELLEFMVDNPRLNPKLRERARTLKSMYPSPTLLAQLVKQDAPWLPDEIAEAICEARRLFLDLHLQIAEGAGCEQTRARVNWVRRHFPTSDADVQGYGETFCRRLQEKAWVTSLGAWILPEDCS